MLDAATLLVTGYTAGGVWHIKDGRITNAINNMRFTDSPLYAFNDVEQIGSAVPVFMPSIETLCPIVVPSIKVKGFALTASSRSI
jgi:predicted Zn-dependent protease